MTSEVQPSRFTGRTLDEALRLAAQQLQVDSPEDLQYRVVEERAGLLFVRPKVTIEAWISEPTQPDEVDARDDCGRVVIEGSAIRVVDQSDNGEPTPVKIFATPPVRLYVDAAEVPPGQAVEVTANNNVVADIGIDQTPSTDVHVHISRDELTAWIEIVKKPAKAYKLECEHTATGCRIVAVEDGLIEPPPYTVDEILQIVRSEGVQYRINEEAIRKAISSELTGRVVVSEGVPAVPTVQDRIDYKFETEERRYDSNGIIDYYEFYVTPCVEEGDVIAELIQGHPGEPGIKVTGEQIPVAPYRPLKLEAGDGATISPDGKRVIAARGGRPVVIRNKICVNQQYELNQGVGLHTSNVHFDGDVIVRGDVSENMLVEATGSIHISGGGYECLLVANNQIQVAKSLVGSRAIAGSTGGLLGKIHYGLRTMIPHLSTVVEATRNVTGLNIDGSPRQDAAARELIETRYRVLPQIASELLKQVEGLDQPFQELSNHSLDYVEFSVPGDVVAIVKLLNASLSRLDVVKWSELESMLATLEHVVGELDKSIKSECSVKIGYCQSSVVETDGDIAIVRQGTVNSTLRAGGDVTVTGVVRGGEVVCLKRFTAKEVGTVAGTDTSITIIDPSGSMKASIVHPNVLITIGTLSYRFMDTHRLVEVKLSPQGAIRVESAGREI